MDSIGSIRRRFRIGDTVWCKGRKCTVVAVYSWRDVILTMEDHDARLFSDSVKATHGEHFRDTYQNVCVDFGESSQWIEARLLNVEQRDREVPKP